MRLRNGFLSAMCTLIAASHGFVLAQQSCETLKNLKLENAIVVSATSQEPTPLKQTPGSPFKVPDVTVASHCEVRAGDEDTGIICCVLKRKLKVEAPKQIHCIAMLNGGGGGCRQRQFG